MGLSLLCPAALPASVLATSLASDDIALRVKNLLAGIWQLPSCSVELAKGLLAATTKVINAAVTANRPEQDIAAERELQTSLRAWLTTPHEDNCVPGAAAGGVVGPGLGGVVPAAPAAKSGALLPVAAALPPSIAPGFLQFCIALVVDPVVAPFKPSHCGNLRRLVAELRSADAAARVAELSRAASADISADGGDVNDGDAALVGMIRELKTVMVFLTALRRTGPALVRFSRLVADALEDACSCIEAYHTAGSPVKGSVAAFEKRWRGTGKTAAEMWSFFLSQFPGASEDPLITGMFFSGRQQCRASAYAVTEVPETGTCAKNYQAARKSFTPGAFLICCACAHPRVLGFVILDKREGPPALLNTIMTRFALLPEYIIYDFGCGAVRSALTKLLWLLCDSTILSDEFHVVNHMCSVSLDPRSFLTLNKANTVAPEQRNRAIKLLSRVLRASGQTEYTRLLAYHTFIHNVRAHARSASPIPLPYLYDF
eukprot:contig_13306_g3174